MFCLRGLDKLLFFSFGFKKLIIYLLIAVLIYYIYEMIH